MGNIPVYRLRRKTRRYKHAQHTAGEKLVDLASRVRSEERKGLFLSVVKGALTVVCQAKTVVGISGFLAASAATALTSIPEKNKQNYEKEIREAAAVLQDLFHESKNLVRAINGNVARIHRIDLSKVTDEICMDNYRKYNSRVRSSVKALNVTLDVVRMSPSLDVPGGGTRIAPTEDADKNSKKCDKWSFLETAIPYIIVNVVLGFTGASVSGTLEELGNTLKQSV